jgi:hypothetical protein
MKQAQKQPNHEIMIIVSKLIKILNEGFVPMSMSNHSNQCHLQLSQLGQHFVLHLKSK